MSADPCIEDRERRMRMTADRIEELRGPLERGSAGDISPAWTARLLEAFDEIELLRAPTRAPEIAGLAKAAFMEGWSEGHSQGRACGGAFYPQSSPSCCLGQNEDEWDASETHRFLQEISYVEPPPDPRDVAILGGDPSL